MKRYRVAHLSVLMIGFVISSPTAVAQLAPAAELPAADTEAAGPSSGPLDASPVLAYTSPTQKQKLRLFEFDAFGPYAIASAVLAGVGEQVSTSPPDWGTGRNAFGMRVASNFGIGLATTTARYGMAEILQEDAAYYRCECRGFFPRFGHALISTLTGRHGRDGHTAFSFSGLLSPYVGSMAALAWYPDRYGVKDGFRMGNYNLAGQAVGNLALEFIYGGPHTLFSHLRSSNAQDGTTKVQSP